jgi:predicted ribosome quality control (RQC) complex YloA/Tae2 family protein
MISETVIFDDIQFQIHIGKNAQENWDLIDASAITDIWFHVQDAPSCHVFLRIDTKLKYIPRAVLVRCSVLCKQNSKSKSVKKCKIMYTEMGNIQKGLYTGEAIAKSYKTMLQ